jgi:peptidyl-dipeptidase A
VTAPAAAPAPHEADLAAFVDALVAEIAPLELEHNREYWLLATTGREEHLRRCAELDSRLRLVFARREPYERLRRIAAAGPVADPLLRRQLELLLNSHRAKQLAPALIERQVLLEKKLEAAFTNFRADLDGERVSDNAILEVLARSDDTAKRHRAWAASKQVGAVVEADLLELVRLRNEGARELGFANYHVMSLELDELDPAWLFELLDQLERDTQPLWDEYKSALDRRLAGRFGCAVGELRPWHYADPFFQQAPPTEANLAVYYEGRDLEALTRDFYRAIGFDITPLLAIADLHERPGKNQHAFCLAVDRGDDIRVLCNLESNEKWMGTMLHEFGHAVYDQCVDRSLPWLLRTHAHILSTEASAMIFGRLSKNAAWLRRWAGADPAALARVAGPVARAVREQLLVATRWELVMIHMERALYADPGQDLRARWWELVERFQGVRRPEGRDAPDWAAKIHFSVAPVYYQNYLLGEMLASQLQETLLERELGGGAGRWERFVSDPAVGTFLRERFYAPGRRWSWRELVERATGRELGTKPFVDDLSGWTAPA